MSGLTIDQTVQYIALAMLLGLVLFAWIGWRQIQSAKRLPFFMLRRRRISQGWRLWVVAFFFALLVLFVSLFGRQVAYTFIPPTPSITPMPTITLTPTITPTPTRTPIPSITPTPSVTPTPTITATPALPLDFEEQIEFQLTPNPQSVFSDIEISQRLGEFNQPIEPAELFDLPLGLLYGTFTYDNLIDGVQWTSIWYKEAEIICSESIPWDGGTGGYGYTECDPGIWLAGEYEIQLFLGSEWMNSVRFRIEDQANALPSASSTP